MLLSVTYGVVSIHSDKRHILHFVCCNFVTYVEKKPVVFRFTLQKLSSIQRAWSLCRPGRGSRTRRRGTWAPRCQWTTAARISAPPESRTGECWRRTRRETTIPRHRHGRPDSFLWRLKYRQTAAVFVTRAQPGSSLGCSVRSSQLFTVKEMNATPYLFISALK